MLCGIFSFITEVVLYSGLCLLIIIIKMWLSATKSKKIEYLESQVFSLVSPRCLLTSGGACPNTSSSRSIYKQRRTVVFHLSTSKYFFFNNLLQKLVTFMHHKSIEQRWLFKTTMFTTVGIWYEKVAYYAVIEDLVIVVISYAVAATMVDAELLTSSTNLTVILSPAIHIAERRPSIKGSWWWWW